MIDKIAGVAAPGATPGPTSGAGFEKELNAPSRSFHGTPKAGPKGATPTAAAPRPAAAQPQKATSVEASPRLSVASAPVSRPGGARLLSEVERAQARLDQLLKMAESGRTFSPAELLAFQAHAFRASQELDMAGKVVEKGTSAVKQTLQTQL
jgi:hypothetical protein